MNLNLSCKSAIITAISLISIFSTQAAVANAPAEQTQVQIERTAQSANPVVQTLTKNLFRTEEYQAEYTVQVPYQVEETYTYEVPYQTTEQYYEDVPYTERVPYTDYETEYRQEYRCHDVTKYRNECRNEQHCYIVPGDGPNCRQVTECGTNAQGQQICKTREVCDGGSGPQQRCENRQVCDNVPYTDRECNYENVPYQVPVTRYRDETRYRKELRTRTVTKYRTETGTRTVTKYREETRCCQTKTREVFDRQLSFQVAVSFPQDAVLSGQEVDVLNLRLVSANPARVEIQVVNSEFGFEIVNQQVNGAAITVELKTKPRYDHSNAGPSSIVNLKLDKVSDRYQVSFRDSVQSSKVLSQYVIVITDQLTGQVIRELPASQPVNGLSVTAVAKSEIPKKTKMVATLHVKREGANIAGGSVQFQTEIARN